MTVELSRLMRLNRNCLCLRLNVFYLFNEACGDGSSPSSLSRADVRRHIGRQLPDAILHGKRSFRPRSRAAQRLSVAGLSSEAFQLASLVIAPPACEPGKDTLETTVRVSTI
jgi:hypothetical protein